MKYDFKSLAFLVSSCLYVLGCGSESGSVSDVKEAKDPKNDMGITILRVDNVNRATGAKIVSSLPEEYPVLQISYKEAAEEPQGGAPKTVKFGIRIDCGSDYAGAFKAFGYDNVRFGSATVITQNSNPYNNLKIDQHSVIACGENGLAHPDSRIFAVAPQDPSQPSRYYLKFGNDKDPKRTNLYDLRCTENFKLAADGVQSALSVSEASLKWLYGAGPAGDDGQSRELRIHPLTCSSDSMGSKIYDLPAFAKPAQVLSPRIPKNTPGIYWVKNEGLDERMNGIDEYLMLVTEGKGFPISCGLDYLPLTNALGVKVDGSTPTLSESDSLVVNARPQQQPILKCSRDDVDRIVKVSTYKDNTYYVRFKGSPNDLVRLACRKVAVLFGQENALETSIKALPYVNEDPAKTQQFDLSCREPDYTDVATAYFDVLGAEPTCDCVLNNLIPDIEAAGIALSINSYADYLVSTRSSSLPEIANVIHRTFQELWKRDPLPQEARTLSDTISSKARLHGKAIRSYFKELVAYLRIETVAPIGNQDSGSSVYELRCPSLTVVDEVLIQRNQNFFGWDSTTNIGIKCSNGQEMLAIPAKDRPITDRLPMANNIEISFKYWLQGIKVGSKGVGNFSYEILKTQCPRNGRVIGVTSKIGGAVESLGLTCQFGS